MKFQATINPGPTFQRYRSISADYSVVGADISRMLEVDPGGGTVTITLPSGIQTGFFCFVRQIAAGTVNFAVGAGASINSLVGGSPSGSAQWGSVVVEKRTTTAWIAAGDLA